MPNNTGLLLLGLGALFFLGRGSPAKSEGDNRILGVQGAGAPMPPAFDLQSYVDALFSETATAPVQPPVSFFWPKDVVVTSSGVPGITPSAPELITPTTRVAIGGDGGETITASALAVRRSEQIVQQEFEYSVTNVQPRTWDATIDANRIEEERQRKFARDLIAKNRAAQLAGNRAVQEDVVRSTVESIPPTITIGDFSYLGDEESESLSVGVASGGVISVSADVPTVEVEDVTFAGEEDDNVFVISGGMDSPMVFAGEEDDTFSLSGVQDYGYGVYYGGAEDE